MVVLPFAAGRGTVQTVKRRGTQEFSSAVAPVDLLPVRLAMQITFPEQVHRQSFSVMAAVAMVAAVLVLIQPVSLHSSLAPAAVPVPRQQPVVSIDSAYPVFLARAAHSFEIYHSSPSFPGHPARHRNQEQASNHSSLTSHHPPQPSSPAVSSPPPPYVGPSSSAPTTFSLFVQQRVPHAVHSAYSYARSSVASPS